MAIRKIIQRKMNTAKILCRKFILFLMKKVYFPGNSFYCPCCGHSLRRFMHYEYKSIPSMNPKLFVHHHKSIQCPYCNSLPRHRMMAYFFQKHPKLIRNKKIVIFGMLQGEKTYFNHHRISYTSADLYDSNAHIKEDLTNLSFADNSVDLLICHHVLEHVKNDQKALEEIRRVLTSDGYAILSVPMDLSFKKTFSLKAIKTPSLRKKYYGQTDHLRLYGTDFLKQLQNIGFRVYVLDGNKLPNRIAPYTGPASTDVNRLFICYANKSIND